jgi:hypothetical protein
MRAEEFQILLGPNTFSNFADVSFIGSFNNTVTRGGDNFTPTWALAPYTADIKLGTLKPGDVLSYTYQLTVRGRTNGAEHGVMGFIGDPFGINITAGNLVPTITLAAVPEPQTWVLLATGLCGIGHVARRRGRTRIARSVG